MNQDQKFWAIIWGMVITGTVIVSLGMSGCVMHSNKKIAEAIKAGANPIEAGIAFSSNEGPMAKVVALLKKENK